MSRRGAIVLEPVGSTPARIIGILVELGSIHRAGLARELGLSRARVGDLVAQLIADHVVVEDSKGTSRSGARTPLALSPGLGVVAGVQFAAAHTDIIVQTLAGETIAEHHQDSPPARTPAEVGFAEAATILDRMLAGTPHAPLLAVGVGGFGQIDPETGTVITTPEEKWWSINLPELGSQTFKVPTVVQNNSRLEALAEARWGAGKGADSVLYLHLGHGLNAVSVIDGEPVNGAHGGAGELDHLSVDINGPLCRCGGRGCLSSAASATAIKRKLRPTFGDDWEAALRAAREGDRVALHAFLDAADVLGIVAAGLANLNDPAIIVIGGDMLRAGPRFTERLITQFRDHALVASRRADVVTATFGGLGPGGARAAALLARRHATAHLTL